MKFDPEAKWQSHTGAKPLKDFEDTHIANLILFLAKVKGHPLHLDLEFRLGLNEYAKGRGLSNHFLQSAPHSYVSNGQTFCGSKSNPSVVHNLTYGTDVQLWF